MTIRKGAENEREQDYQSGYNSIWTYRENITKWLKD